MKRTKSGSQPTRIMPRRGKTRQCSIDTADAEENSQTMPSESDEPQKTRKRVAARSSGRLESPSETEASTLVNTHNSRGRRPKRKRLDRENVTSSESSLANQASSLTDNRGNRDSPELSCSICLSAIVNRAFTNACYHTFCFECLVEWSRVRAVCPLCKKSFQSIIHSFRSYDDYQLYQVPTSYNSNYVNISSDSSNSSSFATVSSDGTIFWQIGNPRVPTARSVNSSDYMVALRRRVYTHSDEMQLRGLWSSDGVVMPPSNQVSPAMFDCYPVMLERIRPWLLRDIAVIIGNGDVERVADVVLELLRHFPIYSEEFYERLFPFLSMHTRRFLLELDAFARSPFDMATYDARVVYSRGLNVETPLRLATEHVEDISSGDDSDIEIVSPAVMSSSLSADNGHASMATDHVVPDLLACLRSFQQSMLASFMSRQSYNSGLESPVPGPSGLGQATAAGESGSMGSHAYSGEERSDSTMVLSDADSDIMVVDVDRPVRSPIHISSGEDDNTTQQTRSYRRTRRRRWRVRHRREHQRETEHSDDETECAVKSETLQTGVAPPSEEHAADHKTAVRSEESSAEELMYAVEQGSSGSHMQDQSSSGSSSAKWNNSSPVSAKSPPSKTELGRSTDSTKDVFRPKRSGSANSITADSVVSETNADDVKPPTCKKHVSGHKSSKRKVKELVTETRSAEAVCNNAEKASTGDRVGTVAGSRDLPDHGSGEQSSDIAREITVSTGGESSIACADFSLNPRLMSSASERMTVDKKLTTDIQLDDGMPVPCTSEMCSLSVASSLGPGLDDIHCSSSSTMEVTCDVPDRCLPAVEEIENSPLCDGNPCSTSRDVVQMCAVDADELPKNAGGIAHDGGNAYDHDLETQVCSVLSSDCIQDDDVDRAVHSGDVLSTDVDAVSTGRLLPSPDLCSVSLPCVPQECKDCGSKPPPNFDVSAAGSTSCVSQIRISSVRSCTLENQDIVNEVDDWLLQNDSGESLPRESEGVSFADSRCWQDSQFNDDSSCLCTDAAGSENQLSLSSSDIGATMSGQIFAGCRSSDHRRSDSSPSHAGLIIDENRPSPASPSAVDSSIVIGSPVGIESSDSEMEVEWVETGVLGRQRCISISSSGSSVVCGASDRDDIESVLSDSDSLEIFDDKPQTSDSEDESAESADVNRTPGDESVSPLSLALLPSTSDVASTLDVSDMETAADSEPTTSEQTSQSHITDGASSTGDGYSDDVTPQSNPVPDGDNQDSDTECSLC